MSILKLSQIKSQQLQISKKRKIDQGPPNGLNQPFPAKRGCEDNLAGVESFMRVWVV